MVNKGNVLNFIYVDFFFKNIFYGIFIKILEILRIVVLMIL